MRFAVLICLWNDDLEHLLGDVECGRILDRVDPHFEFSAITLLRGFLEAHCPRPSPVWGSSAPGKLDTASQKARNLRQRISAAGGNVIWWQMNLWR